MNKKRVLFFDILRIVAIFFVVYSHYPVKIFTNPFFLPGVVWIYPRSIGPLMVYLLIFVSGAVLQLNYSRITSFKEYFAFEIKRIVRIYPAFLISIAIGVVLSIFFLDKIPDNIVLEMTGFYAFTSLGQPFINSMGWFIGAIICLYLLFPVMSNLLKKQPVYWTFIFLIITIISRWFFLNNFGEFSDWWRVLPICNLFEFSLGILVVQKSWFPKNDNEYPIIGKVSELTFYVFLLHLVILEKLGPFNFEILETTGNILIFFIVVSSEILIASIALMLIDNKIQKWFRKILFN